MSSKISLVLGLVFLLFACAPATQPLENQLVEPMTEPAKTPIASTLTPEQPTENSVEVDVIATSTLAPNAWMELPAVPLAVGERAQEIFAYGQMQGNHADVFIKIGDSNSTTTYFLGPFGRGDCVLGTQYADLQPVVKTFETSLLRNSLTVGRGFNASTVLSPLWADKEQCDTGETPLDCELRLTKPAYALIMLGTNDYTRMAQFEPNMRKIIDRLIEGGIVPILSTKGDNLEGDHRINITIARLAYEYQIPLWNLWAALQPLKNHGAQFDDAAHLTWRGCDFTDPDTLQSGAAWRNLTALQVVDKVWRAVQP